VRRVRRGLDFDFDFPTPYPYIHKIYSKYFKEESDPEKKVYHLSRAICLDIYKTYAPLMYSSLVIAMCSIITACFILNYEIPPAYFTKQKAKDTNTMKANIEKEDNTGSNPMSIESGKAESNPPGEADAKLQLIIDWIEDVDPTLDIKEIYELQELFYKFIETYQTY